MSVQKLINALKAQSSIAANAGKYQTTVGIVTAYDPVNRLLQVQLFPATDDAPALQTGWIPLTSAWTGNGYGLFLAPNVNDLVVVHYQEGSLLTAFADSFFFNDTRRPLNVPSGEAWLFHQTGSYIKLTNDGKVSINGQAEIDMTTPTMNITVSGTCTVSAATANVTASAEINLTAPTINLGS